VSSGTDYSEIFCYKFGVLLIFTKIVVAIFFYDAYRLELDEN